MSNQPPYGYDQGGGYPPPPGGYPPPPGGYQGGGYPPPGKTKVMGLDYNVAGLLCYVPICCVNLIFSIIWLTSEPRENRFLRFHALQSLLLIGVAFVIAIIMTFLGFMVAVTPGPYGAGSAGWSFLNLIQLGLSLVFLVLSIIAMVKAYQGEIWKLPIIGDIAEKNS